jgi:hypothetical protein
MRRLEARYRPPVASTNAHVVVAHVTWQAGKDDGRPILEPLPSLMQQAAPATILATLRHLVLITAPKSFERLASLRSPFWSFVAVEPSDLAEPVDGQRVQDAD